MKILKTNSMINDNSTAIKFFRISKRFKTPIKRLDHVFSFDQHFHLDLNISYDQLNFTC